MISIQINKNEHGQRIDRFLKKYLNQASMGFIYKMLRKKNIVLNGKKAVPEDFIHQADTITFYLSDETFQKMRKETEDKYQGDDLDIIFEDDNFLIVNKPTGILSHSTEKTRKEKNIIDAALAYLINKGDYIPRLERTFKPALASRLDRNTSGLLAIGKNYETLQQLNRVFRNNRIEKFYRTIVFGALKEQKRLESTLAKNEKANKVHVAGGDEKGKKAITEIKTIQSNSSASLLQVRLITGRSHQIRVHLADAKHPIMGDPKYGNRTENQKLLKKYHLRHQILHAYCLKFEGFEKSLSYMNGLEIKAEAPEIFNRIASDYFGSLLTED